MLTIKFSQSDNLSRVASVRQNLATQSPQILNDCGSRLVGLAKMYFDVLASGGSTFDGRRWPLPAHSTIAKREALARKGLLRGPVSMQGVLTGAMQQSLKYEVAGVRLQVKYDSSTANYFTHDRPLLPHGLPRPWREECERIASNRLGVNQVSDRSFRQAVKRLARGSR